MRHSFSATMLCLALAVVPATAGQKITEPVTGFEIVFPDNWTTGKVPTVSMPHVTGFIEENGVRAACIVGAEQIASSRGLTQAEMNKALRTPLGRDFWRSRVYGSLNDVVFEADGVREHPSGVVVQEAEVTAGGPGDASAIRLRLMSTFIATPGITYSATCSAPPVAVETYRPVIRAIVDSIRPGQSGLSAAINPSPQTGPAALAVASAAQSNETPAALFGVTAKDAVQSLYSKP